MKKPHDSAIPGDGLNNKEPDMAEEKMLSREEAVGLFDVVKRYLLDGGGELPEPERKGLGRLLSEIQYTLETEPESPGGPALPSIRLVR